MNRFASLLLAPLLALGGVSAAQAADVVAVAIDTPGICGSGPVLNRITNKFRYQVRHVPNLPQVDILDYYQVSESRFEPQGERKPIERRYCHAKAALSDGYTRDVWYLIERPMGFVGFGSNVEFCVSGFDRWNVYGGRCRAIQ